MGVQKASASKQSQKKSTLKFDKDLYKEEGVEKPLKKSSKKLDEKNEHSSLKKLTSKPVKSAKSIDESKNSASVKTSSKFSESTPKKLSKHSSSALKDTHAEDSEDHMPQKTSPSKNPTLSKSKTSSSKSSSVLQKNKYSLESMGEAVCREVACEGLSTSAGYCRLHYIKNWKKIKRKELILREKKLNQYIEELVAKYPDKYIEAIRQDLASDKDFAKVIYDLDLDEGVDDFDIDGDNVDSFIDTIKRDFDDDGDVY